MASRSTGIADSILADFIYRSNRLGKRGSDKGRNQEQIGYTGYDGGSAGGRSMSQLDEQMAGRLEGLFSVQENTGRIHKITYTLVCGMSCMHSEWNKDLCREVNR